MQLSVVMQIYLKKNLKVRRRLLLIEDGRLLLIEDGRLSLICDEY